MVKLQQKIKTKYDDWEIESPTSQTEYSNINIIIYLYIFFYKTIIQIVGLNYPCSHFYI